MEKRKPIVLTDHDCFISGEKVLTDAHGNNASFRCPNCECGYPVLIVAAPRVRHILRGWYKDKGGVPSKCRECGKKYRVEKWDEEEKKLFVVACDD